LLSGLGFTFALTASEPEGVSPAPEYGAQFHCTWSFYDDEARATVVNHLADHGLKWVRIDVGWASIEDTGKGARNELHLANLDTCVANANRRGLKVLVMLWLAPEWARAGGTTDRHPPNNPQDYADFAHWMAARYEGKVDAWEVWNEPDPRQQFWRGTTSQYVELLKAAYPAFKAGDATASVVLGGPSSNDAAWIREVYSLGAKDSFDVMATHPYQPIADQPPEAPGDANRSWFTSFPAVRQVMLDYGDGAKPVWFTEFGWSAHPNWPGIAEWQRGVTLEQQADYAVRAWRYTRDKYPYVKVMMWYKARSLPGSSDVHQQGYGMLDDSLAPRPVLRTLKTLVAG
jgi:polysaccharide biosynthesis protein PslG